MSNAIPLPPRPRPEHYRAVARDLQRACRSGQEGAVRAWAMRWLASIARLRTAKITPESERRIEHEANRLALQWRDLNQSNRTACTLSNAQLFVARAHGFVSWPRFAKHLESMATAGSPVSIFEQAADAIVAGDLPALRTLLTTDPSVVRQRSTREHRSTLLHYVSANGIEDYRQRTPPNVMQIARALLDAGADVNAESDAYAGRSTTLMLTATSCHPEEAGLQLPLLDLLLARGGLIDGPDGASTVNACLHNGRGDAAQHLAGRGATLDLEGAAGVGRLDLVKTRFTPAGRLKRGSTKQQLLDAFAWACEFGHAKVVAFLLDHGVSIDARVKHHGQIGLHWAAYGGHADLVRLLLDRGAPVDTKDRTFNGTPLEWALYAWANSPSRARRGSYHETVALLARAGSKLDPAWFDDDGDRRPAVNKARSDPRMLAALRGEI